VVLRTPRPGSLARFVELVLTDSHARDVEGLGDILTTVGRNQKPHVRELRIGLHTITLVENTCQVDDCFHVPILSRQQEES
jgi:hypothetical protein